MPMSLLVASNPRVFDMIDHDPGDSVPVPAKDDDDDYALDDEDVFDVSATTLSGPSEDHIRIQFENDIEAAKALCQSQKFKAAGVDDQKEQILEFVVARKSQWLDVTTRDGRNFLHHLAYYDYRRHTFAGLQWLMARAILILPNLMGAMDNKKRTPLTAGLVEGNEMFTYSACRNQNKKRQQFFTTALLSECKDHDNDREPTCLHAALTCQFADEKSRAVTVKNICSFVPESMFTVTDFKGRTPLHIAVEYERCCKYQVGIVSELLERGPKALDNTITSYGNNLSVYQYHGNSRKLAEARKKASASQQIQKEISRVVEKNRKDNMPEANAANAEAKMIAPKVERGRMGPPPVLRDLVEFNNPGIQRQDSVKQPTTPKGMEPPRTILSSQERSASIGPVSRIPHAIPAAGRTSLEAEQIQAAHDIAELLKIHYLRLFTPDLISHSLKVPDERGMI